MDRMKTKQKTAPRFFSSVSGTLTALVASLVASLVVSLALPGEALADFGELPPAPPPEAHDDSAATFKNTPVKFRLLDNDTGYYLKVTATGAVKHGTLACSEGGICTWTPARGYTGPDSFPYTVTDSEGQKSSAFVDLFARDDKSAPTGSLTITQDSSSAGSSTVTLVIRASDDGSGVQNMRIANEDKVFSTWEKFAATKIWMLSEGSGLKTVYVKVRDRAGNVAQISQTIRVR